MSDLYTVVEVPEEEILEIESLDLQLVGDTVQYELLEVAAQGPAGPAAFISADLDNRTVRGTDGGIYTPELTSDPLAYYILAKA